MLVRGGATSLLRKANVYEAELSLDAAVRGLAPALGVVEACGALEAGLSVGLPGVRIMGKAIKLQRSRDGGCFPIHFDTDRAIDGRLVTAIVYLNDAWQPGDGGELRLYPFPRAPVTVEPISGRMVLFASRTVPHRYVSSSCPHSRLPPCPAHSRLVNVCKQGAAHQSPAVMLHGVVLGHDNGFPGPLAGRQP